MPHPTTVPSDLMAAKPQKLLMISVTPFCNWPAAGAKIRAPADSKRHHAAVRLQRSKGLAGCENFGHAATESALLFCGKRNITIVAPADHTAVRLQGVKRNPCAKDANHAAGQGAGHGRGVASHHSTSPGHRTAITLQRDESPLVCKDLHNAAGEQTSGGTHIAAENGVAPHDDATVVPDCRERSLGREHFLHMDELLPNSRKCRHQLVPTPRKRCTVL
jgi:hypothetical protein